MTRPDPPLLLAYDIADPKRLVRVHKYLVGEMFPLQYSVFVGRLTPADVSRVIATLAHTIDPRRDDVRLYPLPESALIEHIGAPRLPEGLIAATGLAELQI